MWTDRPNPAFAALREAVRNLEIARDTQSDVWSRAAIGLDRRAEIRAAVQRAYAYLDVCREQAASCGCRVCGKVIPAVDMNQNIVCQSYLTCATGECFEVVIGLAGDERGRAA